MEKIKLKNGQTLECLKVGTRWAYMTEEQMDQHKGPDGQYLKDIETDNGRRFVELGIDIAGEIISVPSFAELLNYGLKQLRISLEVGPKDETDFVKGRIARVLHLIKCSKAPLEDEPDSVEIELKCTPEDALSYLEADRMLDKYYEWKDTINLFGEEISLDSLCHLLCLASTNLVDECNSLIYEYRQLPAQDKETMVLVIKNKCDRNIRCTYIMYLLSGLSPDLAIQKVIEDQGMPKGMPEQCLESDRNWPG